MVTWSAFEKQSRSGLGVIHDAVVQRSEAMPNADEEAACAAALRD
jgi:hypothetical protein